MLLWGWKSIDFLILFNVRSDVVISCQILLIVKKMSSNIARDISREGIINYSLALLRVLLECGYYNNAGIIRGRALYGEIRYFIFSSCLRDKYYIHVLFVGSHLNMNSLKRQGLPFRNWSAILFIEKKINIGVKIFFNWHWNGLDCNLHNF